MSKPAHKQSKDLEARVSALEEKVFGSKKAKATTPPKLPTKSKPKTTKKGE